MVESRSGLACCLWGLKAFDAALAQVDEILGYLATQSLRGAAQPALVYWNCYTVLRAQGDSRASNLLENARKLVQTQAANIQNERLRHAYVNAIPVHRQIAEEVQSLHLSFPFVRAKHNDAV